MMNEIASAVSVAGRVGYQVGLQIQTDNLIHKWVTYANSYKEQRDDAWDQIAASNVRLKNYQQEIQLLRVQINEQRIEALRTQVVRLKKENEGLSEDVRRLAKFKKDALIAMKAQVEQSKVDKASVEASKRNETAALQQVNVIKKLANDQFKQLVEKLNLQTNRLTATWARLTGVERVLGRLLSELVDRAPTLQLEMLNDTQRRIVLLNAWTDVVKSKARYEPALKFTFEPLPI